MRSQVASTRLPLAISGAGGKLGGRPRPAPVDAPASRLVFLPPLSCSAGSSPSRVREAFGVVLEVEALGPPPPPPPPPLFEVEARAEGCQGEGTAGGRGGQVRSRSNPSRGAGLDHEHHWPLW
jgi:hypothetical protein